MTAVFLYFILSFFVLVYLILAQYTRFFQYNLFNMKLSVNLHYYMVILYIFCFLFCIGLSILEWYVACVSELLTPFINQVAYEIVQTEKLQNSIDPSISPSVPPQQSPPGISSPVEKGTGSIFKLNLIPDFIVSKLNDYTFNKIDSVTLADPAFSQAKSHVVQGLRLGCISCVAEGPYTPAQLNLPDLNDAKASIPYYSMQVEINGQIKKAHCFNGPAMICAVNDARELGGCESNRNSYSQSVVRYGIHMQGLGKTTCLVTDKSICSNLPSLKIPVPSGQEIYTPVSPTNNFHTTPGAD